jgi:hypothetical protein
LQLTHLLQDVVVKTAPHSAMANILFIMQQETGLSKKYYTTLVKYSGCDVVQHIRNIASKLLVFSKCYFDTRCYFAICYQVTLVYAALKIISRQTEFLLSAAYLVLANQLTTQVGNHQYAIIAIQALYINGHFAGSGVWIGIQVTIQIFILTNGR